MQTQVLIIGAGVTGTGIARDLAMRGVASVVVEKGDVNSGASGGNHGLLHSGARYLASDPHTAEECGAEGLILKRVAPHCIEETGGLFVAVEGDDEQYIADFPSMCCKHGIPVRELDVREARELEPELSKKLIAAYHVNDASIDPFRLSLGNLEHAIKLGARFLKSNRVTRFRLSRGQIQSVQLMDETTGREHVIEAGVVVNAAGAWAGKVSALAGIEINMVYSKGSLLITSTRMTHRVINRLRYPTDADILVPGGTVSILGTTSVRVESPERFFTELHEIDLMIHEGAVMVPSLETARYTRAYCGVRPLMLAGEGEDDRKVSRGFMLIDHAQDQTPVQNIITITGGKLTTYRLMAEKTADLVCERLGVFEPCKTRTEPLPDAENARWTKPGLAPRMWVKYGDPDDDLLCQCEMVPGSVVDGIVAALEEQGDHPCLQTIGLKSRVGKGPCQGTFCSQRITAHLYHMGKYSGREGISELRSFLQQRWRGRHLLLQDASLGQTELLEAMHCGLFGLELEEDPCTHRS